MSTRIYGMYNFGKYHKIQALRHVVSPSVSMSFSPEKGKAFNGWRTFNYVDTLGVQKSYDYNIYQGQINSAPGKGKSATMSISLGNNLEAKVRDMKDTTGTGSKKVKILDQFNFSTGYNFLADSLKMNNVGLSMSTSIFGKLGINGNMNSPTSAPLCHIHCPAKALSKATTVRNLQAGTAAAPAIRPTTTEEYTIIL